MSTSLFTRDSTGNYVPWSGPEDRSIFTRGYIQQQQYHQRPLNPDATEWGPTTYYNSGYYPFRRGRGGRRPRGGRGGFRTGRSQSRNRGQQQRSQSRRRARSASRRRSTSRDSRGSTSSWKSKNNKKSTADPTGVYADCVLVDSSGATTGYNVTNPHCHDDDEVLDTRLNKWTVPSQSHICRIEHKDTGSFVKHYYTFCYRTEKPDNKQRKNKKVVIKESKQEQNEGEEGQSTGLLASLASAFAPSE